MSPVEILYEGEAGTWIVGRAAQRGSTTFIEYTDEHLARNVELAPVHHRRDTKTRIFEGRSPEHLPGLLSDALPDAWGRLVVGRDMRQHGIDQASALQILTWLGRRTMGALTFRPVEGPQTYDGQLVDLDRVQDEMLRHLAGLEPEDLPADALTRAAGSGAGGARPKLAVSMTADGSLVADNLTAPVGTTPWLVKFHSTEDSPFLSAIEATYLQMATAAGITTCAYKLLSGSSGTQFLAVKRFDRVVLADGATQRVHMATAAGLLEAYPEFHQHRSYEDIIRLTRLITGDMRDVTEVVRRAVFNVIAHNRDDHARNISFLWSPAEDWRLAPAYDLTYSMGPRPEFVGVGPGEHYLDVAGKGTNISRKDLRSLTAAAGLKLGDIDEMIDRTLTAVGSWEQAAAAHGVDSKLITEIGLRLPALSM
jgi:serine/threonine-protein kinase HipA